MKLIPFIPYSKIPNTNSIQEFLFSSSVIENRFKEWSLDKQQEYVFDRLAQWLLNMGGVTERFGTSRLSLYLKKLSIECAVNSDTGLWLDDKDYDKVLKYAAQAFLSKSRMPITATTEDAVTALLVYWKLNGGPGGK